MISESQAPANNPAHLGPAHGQRLKAVSAAPGVRLVFIGCLFAALSALCEGSDRTNSVVNLSHYDTVRPDFGRMRREGVVGVIHEATYPPSTPDFAYGGRQNAALDAGLLWGAYHYANATNPTRQADHFLDVVTANWRRSGGPSGSPGVLLVLDFEKNGHYPGGTMGVGQAADFVERIRSRTGRYPGLYSGENRIKQVLNEPGLDPGVKRSLQNCWLWVANYHYVPTATAPWTRWHLWQYTGDGICDLPRLGFPTSVANLRNVERNLFNGSAKDLLGFWQANAWRP